MKRTKAARTGAAAEKPTAAPKVKQQTRAAPAEVDRRGKVLPARQRVGGIITPQ